MVLLAAVLAGGCLGGDGRGGGGGGGGGSPVSLADLPEALGGAACDKMFDCCTEAEIMMQFESIDPPPSTPEECQALLAGFLGLGTSTWMESQDAGRLAYHADAAGDCIAAIRSLTCDAYHGGVTEEPAGAAACDEMIEPLVDEGGACSQDAECTTGFCDGATGDMDGACAVPPAEGEDCVFDCAEGLFCDFDSGSTCQPEKADGADCDSDSQCASGDCVGADPSMGISGTCGTEAVCSG